MDMNQEYPDNDSSKKIENIDPVHEAPKIEPWLLNGIKVRVGSGLLAPSIIDDITKQVNDTL